MSATYTEPFDHVHKSIRDDNCRQRDEAIERLKAMYCDANAVAAAIRSVTEKQAGELTRAQGLILSIMVRANLRAAARGEFYYRPTRAGLAKDTGLSEKTVSRAITRHKELELVDVARYGKGGRVGSHGLATEFRTGGLDGLIDRLRDLGYRIGSRIADTIIKALNWARARLEKLAVQMKNRAEANLKKVVPNLKKKAAKPQQNISETANPTGTLCPGTLECSSNAHSRHGWGGTEPPARTPDYRHDGKVCASPSQRNDALVDPRTLATERYMGAFGLGQSPKPSLAQRAFVAVMRRNSERRTGGSVRKYRGQNGTVLVACSRSANVAIAGEPAILAQGNPDNEHKPDTLPVCGAWEGVRDTLAQAQADFEALKDPSEERAMA